MEENKKLKPLGDRVFVKPNEDDVKKTAAGIILTDSSTQGKKVYGTVAAVSDGYFSPNGIKVPLSVSVGDEVMYLHGHGDKLELGDVEYLIFKEHELIAFVRK